MQRIARHILVTGAHRSGTTWVGHTIALSRNVRYVSEPFNVAYPNNEVDFKLERSFTYAPASRQLKEIQISFERLLNNNPFHRAWNICKIRGLDAKTPLRLCKHLILQSRPTRSLIKDPIALLSADWLHQMFGFSVVCMIRNPLGFVGSLKKAGWEFNFRDLVVQQELLKTRLSQFETEITEFCNNPGDIVDQACLLWNILHSVILDYQKEYPSWLFVKYEDLASNPIEGFQEIFRYLDLRLSIRIQESIKEFTSTENPSETDTTTFGPRNAQGSLETWKKRLTSEEIDRVIQKTQAIAQKFYCDFV